MVPPIFKNINVSNRFSQKVGYMTFKGSVAVDFFGRMIPIMFSAESVNPLKETKVCCPKNGFCF